MQQDIHTSKKNTNSTSIQQEYKKNAHEKQIM